MKIGQKEEKAIVEDYSNGLSITKICQKYHHKFNIITQILDKNDIYHGRNKSNPKNRKQLTSEQINKIIYLYTVEHRGQLYCAKAAGLGNSTRVVKRVLKENNIHIRNYSEAAIESNQNRAYFKNKEYFDAESPNMAYIMGFLASDGNISKRDNSIKIALSSVDREILEKIKKEIEIENDITDTITNNGFPVSTLTWSCKQHKEKLALYGIIPNKTFLLTPPYALQKKYWIDYIRGYFDGDGSINLLNSGYWRWQICSVKEIFLQWVIDFLYDEYQIPKVNVLYDECHGKNGIYYFQYSTNAAKQIYNILYTPNSLCLKRKKEKFDKIIK